jgi:hypothetical protein
VIKASPARAADEGERPVEHKENHPQLGHHPQFAKPYQTPTLVKLGKMAELTAAGSGQVIEAFAQVQPVRVCVTIISNRPCNAG